ncbi:ubiquinone biosynthesis protein UbiE [Aminobacter sp. Y103A]|jgi:ubiquinone/menaquinone biosynthesis C-methylase UbiE|uniref:Ubiquinone biosynthesis protein UbiE n=1 Tax=Aminobacter aminovorans TaxID=83263 RepID=A0AAC8YJF0_AMIAI|nr:MULTISPECIES: class I SAM-dependent methyltransferase [Aminobacter]AMS39288.1 ubiquinone biosynthesis protein UbiE [Aminobacter aminovorans]MBB3709166.1 ubiquinone/menaquinone biosynthesis C-methylase UbiE [Aminobacter aminovorans]BBD35519.1 ubiquinone biosynthesis protein UbiE [Aminobacter sp. SS-2016]
MSIASDARFWDRSSRRYAKAAVADQSGYARTLDRTRGLLRAGDQVLELGCGTGSTAMLLAGDVKSYLGTDFSPAMIEIAEEKRLVCPIRGLDFLTATAEAHQLGSGQFEVVLGFNYLHLVRDLPGTLRRIHTLLASDGLFVSKTPCLGDMNPLIRLALLPVMRATGLAPHAGAFSTEELVRMISAAGFEVVATENHATKGNDNRPYIVARKR